MLGCRLPGFSEAYRRRVAKPGEWIRVPDLRETLGAGSSFAERPALQIF